MHSNCNHPFVCRRACSLPPRRVGQGGRPLHVAQTQVSTERACSAEL